MIIEHIKTFLTSRLEEQKLDRKVFTQDSGIPYSTITHLLKGTQKNPSILTLIKIANHFHCFVDEIIGRDVYIHNLKKNDINHDISLDNVDIYIKKFLLEQISRKKLNIYKLSRDLGFSSNVLHGYLYRTTRIQKTLNTPIIISLANYFKVPIDVIIGRMQL